MASRLPGSLLFHKWHQLWSPPYNSLEWKPAASAPTQRSPASRSTGWSFLWLQISTGLFSLLSRVIQIQGDRKKTKWADSHCSFDLSASSMAQTGREKMKVEEHEIGKIKNLKIGFDDLWRLLTCVPRGWWGDIEDRDLWRSERINLEGKLVA